MDIFEEAAEKIIKGQETIIGPIALEQARKVAGLKIDRVNHEVKLEGNKTEILGNLVGQYERLFGKTSVEVCREAVRTLMSKFPQNQIPSLLQ